MDVPSRSIVHCEEGVDHYMFLIVGLGVTCSPRDPRFTGSNSAEVDGFFSGSKNPEHKSSGRDFKLGEENGEDKMVRESN